MSQVDQLRVIGSEWSLNNGPAVGVQATATHAATPGQRHVVTSATFTIFNFNAAGGVYIVVRDGASGVGAIIWQGLISSPATTGQSNNLVIPFGSDGLRGGYGNQLTIEYLNGQGNVQQTISGNGYMECQFP